MQLSASSKFFAGTACLGILVASTVIEGPEALDSFLACLPGHKLLATAISVVGLAVLLAYVAEVGIALLWWVSVAWTHRRRYRANPLWFANYDLGNPLKGIAAASEMDAESVRRFIDQCNAQTDSKARYLNAIRLAGLASIPYFATCSSCNAGASGCSLEPLVPLYMGLFPTLSAMIRSRFPDDRLLLKYRTLSTQDSVV